MIESRRLLAVVAEPVGWQGDWGDDVHDDCLALGGAALCSLLLAVAEPTVVVVRPVDRRGSLVVRDRLRTRALGDELEANSGSRSRALGCASTAAHVAWPRRVGPATAAAIMSPLVAPVPPCRGGRRCLTGSGSRGQVANFPVFRSRSNRCVFNCKCRDFVPIHICHLSQHTLSTRYCHFASSWNCPATRPPRLKIT